QVGFDLGIFPSMEMVIVFLLQKLCRHTSLVHITGKHVLLLDDVAFAEDLDQVEQQVMVGVVGLGVCPVLHDGVAYVEYNGEVPSFTIEQGFPVKAINADIGHFKCCLSMGLHRYSLGVRDGWLCLYYGSSRAGRSSGAGKSGKVRRRSGQW